MSRHTIMVRGDDNGFTAEFSTKELEVQSEGSTLSEALMKLAEELALHENDSESLPEDAAVIRYKHMN